MIASTCQHFRFGGATASLKNWHLTIHDCKHASTLPFWGRYGQPKKLTFNNPWLQALVTTFLLEWYSKHANLTYDVPWLQALVNTSFFPTKQNFERCMAKPLVKLQFFKRHVGVNPCGKCILAEKFFSGKPSSSSFSSSSSSPVVYCWWLCF